MKRLKVSLGDRSYDILIGSGLLEQTGRLVKEHIAAGRLVIITNPTVQQLYGNRLAASLSKGGFRVDIITVADGEEYKTLETAGNLYTRLAECQAERTTPILALGGGVIGDLAGFVAATYKRGVPLIQIPTTLLAQVDSSIGGKVAVDHGRLKNEIGAFYQPRLVISDTSTLKTLTESQFSNGMAEVIKSAVIKDRELFGFIEKNNNTITKREDNVLETTSSSTAAIKAAVVSVDERDTGLRNILNFGHTVAHAIETVSGFGIQHGQAVAIGMLVEAGIAVRLGFFSNEDLARLKCLIESAGLPTSIPQLDSDNLIAAMQHDKKITAGKVRFALPKAIGDVFVTDEVESAVVREVLTTR